MQRENLCNRHREKAVNVVFSHNHSMILYSFILEISTYLCNVQISFQPLMERVLELTAIVLRFVLTNK